jgi:secreted PhoX family phosphatase
MFRYGPLKKDSSGYLDLPDGFNYKIISKAGRQMEDGFILPGAADGMAAFAFSPSKVILIRNHELSPGSEKGPFGKNNELLSNLNKADIYDYGYGKSPAMGGTTSLVYNEITQQVELEYLSLAGTTRNCAGGPTPWGSWISCEENVASISEDREQAHGYNFEVPASGSIQIAPPNPLKAMGRFNHEAVCVDPKTSIVYQTEDRGDSLIYRFIPNTKNKLADGGRLQVLCFVGQKRMDTRNWSGRSVDIGFAYDVEWKDIDDVESPDDDLRLRGFEGLGAARFARGEGMWFGNNELFFACTNGGPDELGQVFKYVPSQYEGTPQEASTPGKLYLFAESDNKNILKNCDNLTISPWGDVILCEDHKDAFIRGITPDGQIYTFGHNVGSQSEFAGATFSPSGKTLFVNIQGNGDTVAITGPWGNRADLS